MNLSTVLVKQRSGRTWELVRNVPGRPSVPCTLDPGMMFDPEVLVINLGLEDDQDGSDLKSPSYSTWLYPLDQTSGVFANWTATTAQPQDMPSWVVEACHELFWAVPSNADSLEGRIYTCDYLSREYEVLTDTLVVPASGPAFRPSALTVRWTYRVRSDGRAEMLFSATAAPDPFSLGCHGLAHWSGSGGHLGFDEAIPEWVRDLIRAGRNDLKAAVEPSRH